MKQHRPKDPVLEIVLDPQRALHLLPLLSVGLCHPQVDGDTNISETGQQLLKALLKGLVDAGTMTEADAHTYLNDSHKKIYRSRLFVEQLRNRN